MQSKDFEIAIIGGGIAGLTLAIALNHRNIPVKIYEQAPKFGEIGAGVAFTGNAVQSMKVCHQGIYEAFEKVRTTNAWSSKKNIWFDYLNGMDKSERAKGHQEAIFSITSDIGQAGVHRAAFLDAMVGLLPEHLAVFGKHLDRITEESNGKLRMHFSDNSTAEADAIIGCDGIRSKVRGIMFGQDHPCARPTYTYKYAYRGLVPMEKAIEAVGEERAMNACMHVGKDNHVLTFPVSHGKILNIVAFHTTDKDWPDYSKSTLPAEREDALKDFEGFGPNVMSLLQLTKPDLDRWAIFHLGDHPVPSMNKGRILISGDAAHATSPHHGAGAGMCIEDSAHIAELLADGRVRSPKDVEAVFSTINEVRKERGQWLVQSSQRIGDTYEWRAEGIMDDFAKIEKEIIERNRIIADVDVKQMCRDAQGVLGTQLRQTSSL